MEPKLESQVQKLISELTEMLLNQYNPDEQNEIIAGIIARVNDNRKVAIEKNIQESKHLEDCILTLRLA